MTALYLKFVQKVLVENQAKIPETLVRHSQKFSIIKIGLFSKLIMHIHS